MDQTRFAARRAEFIEKLGDAIAVIPAAKLQTRNDDVDHDFRQDSDFFFLTGFEEPDSIAVFDPSHDTENYTLFVRPRDREMESWNGRRAGTEGATEKHGADTAHTLDEFDLWIKNRLVGHPGLVYATGGAHDAEVLGAVTAARRYALGAGVTVPTYVADAGSILSEMRLFKSPLEIDALRMACRISARAHTEAMRFTEPGMNERHVGAALEYIFSTMGAQRPGYGSIVGGGDNATILHYVENNQELRNGDLVLIDAGAEYDHLTADVTRTFPIGGKFSPPQRALYELTLAAEKEVIQLCRPGTPFSDMHIKAVETLSHGLVDLGLLPGAADEVIEKGWYREYFFHGTGHWLGIDVHDAGAYRVNGASRKLEPSMAFTVEPGLYLAPDRGTLNLSNAVYDPTEARNLPFKLGASKAKAEFAERAESAGSIEFTVPEEFLGIGIRIEDDILITEDGHDNMSSGCPVEPGDIEDTWLEESVLTLAELS